MHRGAIVLLAASTACGRVGFEAQIDAIDAIDAPSTTFLKASNAEAGDRFDAAVLSSTGRTLVVGAGLESSAATGVDGDQANNAAPMSGAAYVFELQSTGWNQTAYLKASNTLIDGRFGYRNQVSMADDGNTIAIGSTRDRSAATGIDGDQSDVAAPSAGAAYVFARSGPTWVQQAYVKATNTAMNDQFGPTALSADGNTLAVGGLAEDSGTAANPNDNSINGSGAVYVYSRIGTTWSPVAYLKAQTPMANESLGQALAMSADGTRIVAGGDGGGAAVTGRAEVFRRDGSTWVNEATLMGVGSELFDQFGYSVAISGDGATIAIGAVEEDSTAVGIDGDASNNVANGSGAVYVFARTDTSWSQQSYVKSDFTMAGDQFGWAVSLDGDGSTLAVGAVLADGGGIYNSGTVVFFTRTGTQWQQVNTVSSPQPVASDAFGASVSLSADGSKVAVGVRYDDVAGADSGAVYVLTR